MQRLLHQFRHALQTPSRTPRMAVVVGRLLAAAFLVCFATGIYSHLLQDPAPWMAFPTRPSWLYQVSQGAHITAGIICFPLLFAKLYAVFPQLFQTPPVRSFGHVVERASIALFVAASLVQITIGLLNTYQFYSLFPFSFRHVHFALSFVVIGSLAIHIAVKLPIIARYWRARDAYLDDGTLREGESASDPDVAFGTPDELQRRTGIRPDAGVTGRIFAWIDEKPTPEPPDRRAKVSRRGFLAAVGAAAGVLVAFTAGQSFRILDPLNLLAPRKNNTGPQSVPVNRTAQAAGVEEAATAPDWTLTVSNGERSRSFSYDELAMLPQYDAWLPIACVEGWSQYAWWRGPRLRDLVDAVGATAEAGVRITSLQQHSIYAVTEMQPEFVRDELTLVALELNGETLDLDHGYPARIIAPARPGVLQTKWLSRLEVI
ncbi:molybdopterin-dependent oxidoreductase [Homoserinibacter sp. GY 40078]|nr:molybdopterin-dependent oxidoreductase [Homoserinibacter sp. GY 40078]